MELRLRLFFLAGHASASVSNPDYYDIDVAEGAFIPVGSSSDRIGDFTGFLSGDIAANTDFTYDDSFFNQSPTTLSGIDHIIQINPAGTSGSVDPASGDVSLTLQLRVKFVQAPSGPSVPAGCQTSYFTLTATTSKSATYASPSGFDTGSGHFTVVAEDFAVPAVTTGACGSGLASSINTTFDLGGPSGRHTFYLQASITNPQIPQP